jgi:tartrate-resistant acid phosphatase type 5
MMQKTLAKLGAVTAIALALTGCAPKPITEPEPKYANISQVIAVISDFGTARKAQRSVANMVASFNPSFVVTAGDNIYTKKKGYKKLVGDYYPQKIVPVPGNHDYLEGIDKYDAYFGTTPTTRTYVHSAESGVDFFMIDSDPGLTSYKVRREQREWLLKATTASKALYKVVVLHHPPFSSGKHGSTKKYQWDFATYGIDLVISGHDHTYERIVRGGTTYVVVGTGGAKLYDCRKKLVWGSLGCNDRRYGAMMLNVNSHQLRAVFHGTAGQPLDLFTINP